jgi:hypothetical protein
MFYSRKNFYIKKGDNFMKTSAIHLERSKGYDYKLLPTSNFEMGLEKLGITEPSLISSEQISGA